MLHIITIYKNHKIIYISKFVANEAINMLLVDPDKKINCLTTIIKKKNLYYKLVSKGINHTLRTIKSVYITYYSICITKSPSKGFGYCFYLIQKNGISFSKDKVYVKVLVESISTKIGKIVREKHILKKNDFVSSIFPFSLISV